MSRVLYQKKLLIILFLFVFTNSFSAISQNKFSLLKQMNGTWVDIDALNSIVKTKSPFQSFNTNAGGYRTLYIDTGSLENNDSLQVGIGESGHEADYLYIYLNKKSNPNSLHCSCFGYGCDYGHFSELQLKINGNDTLLYLNEFDSSGKTIYSDMFRKCNDGIEGFINRKLFVGHYELIDTVKNSTTKFVDFYSDGRIVGLGSYIKYEIMLDAFMLTEVGSDNIILDFHEDCPEPLQPDCASSLGFIISGDTLKLYNFDSSWYDTNNFPLKFGNLKYILIKKN